MPELKQSLRTLSIGTNDFRNAQQVNIDGFRELTSISFGDNSFDSNIGYLSIWNCSKLQSISFGRYVFQFAESLSIYDLPQLNSVAFNQNSFQYTKTANLYNLDSISGLYFDNNCFQNVDHFSIKSQLWLLYYWWVDIPNLLSVEMKDHSVKQVKVVIFESN